MSLRIDLGVRAAVLGRVGVDDPLIEQTAATVEHGHLATGAETGVDGQHDLFGDRRLEQQAAEVFGEDLDGVLLGPIAQVTSDFALHAGEDEAVQGIDGGRAEKLGVGMALKRKLGEEGGLELGSGQVEADLERTFLVTSVDGEHAVRRDLRDGLGIIKIVAVFQALAFGDLGLGGDDLAGLPHQAANRRRGRRPSR